MSLIFIFVRKVVCLFFEMRDMTMQTLMMEKIQGRASEEGR